MKKHTWDFKRDTVRIALTSGLSHERVPAYLGAGQSTLHKWIVDYRLNDLTIDPQAVSALNN